METSLTDSWLKGRVTQRSRKFSGEGFTSGGRCGSLSVGASPVDTYTDGGQGDGLKAGYPRRPPDVNPSPENFRWHPVYLTPISPFSIDNVRLTSTLLFRYSDVEVAFSLQLKNF